MKVAVPLAGNFADIGRYRGRAATLYYRAKALAGEVIFSSRALSVAPFFVGGLLYLINPRNS